MTQNIFEELLDKKQKMVALINKAGEFGWINADEQKAYLSKLENDELTIGVIGQMKAGKSTFLNSFVFEDQVLPAATTPMTAALSAITYGPEKRLVAEFYTSAEWQEQQMTAKMDIEGTNDELLKSKVKAARELVEKAVKLGGSLQSYLGKTQEDKFENLEEYVGADGKYVAIVKSVTIYYPKEYLKGVRIVDTPGFNDPIVSREERTKEFLKKADVVLLMLYAGRPFDATDRSILFKNVGECGIGKVLIGINKYDIPYENGDSENKICEYVINEIAKAGREMGDDQLNEILRETTPIPLSAEMALLSMLDMSKITADDSLSHAWHRACDIFDISSQKQMRQKSYIDNMINAVRELIEKEKMAILIRKPLNAILAKGNSLLAKINNAIDETKREITMLEVPDDELEEIESKLARVTKRINRKIDNLEGDLDSTFREIVRQGSDRLEDEVDDACRRMDRFVDEWGRFKDVEDLEKKLENEFNLLITRKLKRRMNEIIEDAKQSVQNTLNDFFADAEDILTKLPADDSFDQREFIKSVSREIDFSSDDSLFTVTDENGSDDYGVMDFVADFANGFFWGLPSLAGNFFSHGDNANKAREWINSIRSQFNAKPMLESISGSKDKIIQVIKSQFIENLLDPFQAKLTEIKNQGAMKEQKLEAAKQLLCKLEKDQSSFKSQMEEIQSMKFA